MCRCIEAKYSQRAAANIRELHQPIENEPKLRPTVERLTALANGLGVPAEELFARVAGYVPKGGSPEEIELLARFRKLSPERRDDLLRLVDLYYQKDVI